MHRCLFIKEKEDISKMPIHTEIISQQLLNYLNEDIMDEPVEAAYDTPFSEMGVESYDVIQLVLFIERKFGVELSESDLTPDNLKSIASLSSCTSKYL